jgi:uncharacterized protein DUF3761
MKNVLVSLGAALALAASTAWAKAPPDATGECKDGTYTTAAQKEGACSSHGGVKKWLAKEDKADKAKASDKSEKSSKSADKPATAAAASPKPADATGQCKDDTYTTSATKSGACAGHKGVKTWYGSDDKAQAKAAPKSAATTPAAATGAAAGTAAPAKSAAAPAKTAAPPPAERTAAAGGGAGKVWVNTDSKVYHCEKDAMYGKTKQGEYMSEAQAKASGARAARGKECS